MAVTIKQNQALAFTAYDAAATALNICSGADDYCQPVQTDDWIYIQGTIGENSTTNLSVLAGWAFGTGWSNVSGVITGDGVPNDTTQAASNDLGLLPNTRYSIYIDATTLINQQYIGPATFLAETMINPNSIYIPTTGYVLNPGDTFTVTGSASNNGTFTVVSTVISTGIAIVVEEAVVNETPASVTITMPDTYLPTPNEGYRIKLNGAYLDLPIVAPDTTGDFTSQAYLLRYIYSSASIIDDKIRIECSDPDIIVKINSVIIRNMSRVGAALYKDGGFVVSSDVPSGITYYPVDTYISNVSGTENLDFVPLLWNYKIIIATLFGGGLDGCYQISLYDSFGEVDDPKTAVSNCFEVKETQPCTLLFNADNDDNAFGFDYVTDTQFQHFLRVYSKMDITGYPEEADGPYIFSNNSRVLMFARRDREFSLFIGDAPNHIHDLLSIMRLHDTFAVGTTIFFDLVEYVKESGYDLGRRKSSTLKQATFTVLEKQGLASNFPCN